MLTLCYSIWSLTSDPVCSSIVTVACIVSSPGMASRISGVAVALHQVNVGALSEFSIDYMDVTSIAINWRKGAVVDLTLGLGPLVPLLYLIRSFLFSNYFYEYPISNNQITASILVN